MEVDLLYLYPPKEQWSNKSRQLQLFLATGTEQTVTEQTHLLVKLPHHPFIISSVILLPLRPKSLTHKNPQRHKIIIFMARVRVGCKD